MLIKYQIMCTYLCRYMYIHGSFTFWLLNILYRRLYIFFFITWKCAFVILVSGNKNVWFVFCLDSHIIQWFCTYLATHFLQEQKFCGFHVNFAAPVFLHLLFLFCFFVCFCLPFCVFVVPLLSSSVHLLSSKWRVRLTKWNASILLALFVNEVLQL